MSLEKQNVHWYLYFLLSLNIYILRYNCFLIFAIKFYKLQEEGKVSRALNKNDPLSVSKGCAMSVLVGTGNKIWSGVYVISSTLGFILCLGLLDIYYINPYGVSFWWYKGLLFLGCMAVGVVVFGGIVIGLWYAWEKRTSDYESKTIRDVVQQNEAMAHKDSSPVSLSGASSTVMYGRRPDFEGMCIMFVWNFHFFKSKEKI